MQFFAALTVVISLAISAVSAGSGHIGEHDCYNINCGSTAYIQITYAHYGIRYWCDASNEVGVLNSRCYGQSSCQVCATNGWFGDPCVGTYKYLWFNWDCKSRAVNGNWGGWGGWGSCTKSCASGTKYRYRSCNNPAPSGGGSYCSGSSSSSTSCNTHYCPINGGYTSWTSWGSCSKTCGGGTKSRSRTCTNPAPAYGGNDCSSLGSTSSSTSCNTHNCPIHGNWAAWGSWGSCTVTCGGGTKGRNRTCTDPAPQYLGNDCAGSASSSTTCNTHHCPIDGSWASWASWGTCTVTCGGGIQTRSRNCSSPAPQYGGADCPNFSTSSQTCNTHNCPIDGAWATWTSWGTCTVTCGGGTQTRSRTCTNPAPQYGGANCPGSAGSSQACNTQHCPIDGSWASWGSWGTCSVTCGGGTQDRTRTCTNPSPQYGGASCPNSGTSTQACNTQICIIDGAWGAWQQWGSCTKTCAGGRKSRSRICDSPKPANGGLECPGSSGDFADCNTQDCPTVAAGTYQQLCPTGYFTCKSGSMTCIQNTFQCDCSSECDDGSDEDATYAGCTNTEECLLRGSAVLVSLDYQAENDLSLLELQAGCGYAEKMVAGSLTVGGRRLIIFCCPTIPRTFRVKGRNV
ncbi:coadhesin-like [Crassostrea virginica]